MVTLFPSFFHCGLNISNHTSITSILSTAKLKLILSQDFIHSSGLQAESGPGFLVEEYRTQAVTPESVDGFTNKGETLELGVYMCSENAFMHWLGTLPEASVAGMKPQERAISLRRECADSSAHK